MADSKNQSLEKTAFWVLLGVLLVVFFWLLKPFYSVLLLSLVLALISQPLFEFFLKIFKQRRYLSAFFCLVLFLLFAALPVAFVISAVAEQTIRAAQSLGEHFTLNQGFLTQIFEHWQQTLGVEIDLYHWFKEFVQNAAQYLYQFSPKVISNTASFFLGGLLTLILTYFLLVDGPKLYHQILEVSPLKNTYEKTLANEISVTLRACIYGYLLTALVQGILAGIGFWVIGIPVALLLGLATFIMAFVPIVGTGSVWVPVFIYLLAAGQYGKATFLFIYGFFVISGIDNILKPLLIQGKTNIHPVLLFLAIFGGLKLWGPVGLLAGPTLVAVLLATLKIYKKDFQTN
ncbi:MAG: hypothetical protein A3H42_00840 [Deltaproteobacteria bacterium RIFCSPLOWO2_02_FULL_46_8]|nr:MAG: hypothetical protein A3H42_00840 [Deltaproteobacteria bacterium RIFCSPLOWO2_02_FULL_46_8]